MLEYHTGFDLIAVGGSTATEIALSQLGWTHPVSPQCASTIVRNGTRSVYFSAGGASLGMANLSNAATRVVGFGLHPTSLVGVGYVVASVADGHPTTNATTQIGLAMTSVGRLEVRRGAGAGAQSGTLLATSVNALVANTWQFIELVVTVHATAGAVEVYVNGSKTGWIDFVGNTQQTANAYSNGFALGGISGQQVYFDDVYTLTATGAAPTARLGDCKSVVKLAGTDVALGAGVYGDSTPSTGTDRGAMVDEAQPDDDTTYTSLTAALQKDSYKTVALGQTGTIFGATIRARLKKADAGDGSAQIGLRSGSTDDLGFDVFPSETSYLWFARQYPTNPASALPWTVGALDLAQILVKRTL